MVDFSFSPFDPYIRRYATHYGNDPIFVAAVASIVRAEGGFGPTWPTSGPGVGDNGNSFGPYQMNRAGGLGSPYTPAQLVDPNFSSSIMIPLFEQAYSNLRGEYLSFPELTARLGVAVERPQDQSGQAYYVSARGYANQVQQVLAQFGGQLPPENNIPPGYTGPPDTGGLQSGQGVTPTLPPPGPTVQGPQRAISQAVADALGGFAQATWGSLSSQHLATGLLFIVGVVLLIIALFAFAGPKVASGAGAVAKFAAIE